MVDWSKAKPGVVDRIVSEGEAYLNGQLKLATSADQRAAVLAGVFTAAVLAGLIALGAGGATASGHYYPIYVGGGVMVICFLAGAALCIAAIFPVGFWLPGNEPESWFGDVAAAKELDTALCEEAEHIQSKIAENRGVVTKNARRFKWGAILGIAAPVAGFLLWLVTSSAYWISG